MTIRHSGKKYKLGEKTCERGDNMKYDPTKSANQIDFLLISGDNWSIPEVKSEHLEEVIAKCCKVRYITVPSLLTTHAHK